MTKTKKTTVFANKMNTNKLKITDEIPQNVADCLKNGGVIAHATETVYGLACRWDDESALERVAIIKQRPPEQPYSLLVNDVDSICQLTGMNDLQMRNFLETLFPAPVTVLLPRIRDAKIAFWNGFPLLGFRLPDDPLCQKLVAAAGAPLITTSANLSGEAPPVSAEQLSGKIAQKVDFTLDSGTCKYQIPSTVVQLNNTLDTYRVIRTGAFSTKDFDEIFRKFSSRKKQF